jgi:hypothetical protein
MSAEWVELCDHGDRFFGCSKCWPVEPELAPAFRGLAGDFVRSFVLETEAHPAALLGSFLALAGNQFGPRAHMRVGASHHPGRLFVVIVGETSVARKGMSWAETTSVFEEAFPGWRTEPRYRTTSSNAVSSRRRATWSRSSPTSPRRSCAES